ncbi:MAG TPA: MerR family transcriptional regulator, partial [Candidatus Dormibacteraeota bacterium]
LLGASPERFAVAITEVDRSLQARAKELRRTRERIARLNGGDRLFVSADVADYLDRLRELGVSRRSVQMERDGWILLQSASPKAAAVWFAEKLDAIHDPEFVAIYLEYDAAFEWPADDPRLEALADRSARWFSTRGGSPVTRRNQPVADPGIIQLITTSTGSSSPAWDRLREIARERTGRRPS